jgi:hypothetical protein
LISSPANAWDLNQDGFEDLVVCNYEDGKSFNLNSYIYWGSANGNFFRKTELETHGARAARVSDLNRDGFPDILFSNYTNGESRKIESYIYWGDAEASYKHRTGLPTVSGYGISVADLNRDGYKDIVFSNYSDGDRAAISSYVYWGDVSFEYKNRLELPTHGALGNAVADLNADGHLDIVFCSQNNESTSAKSYIYWGNPDASYSERAEIPTQHPYDVTTADLDRDGHLDLVFSEFSEAPSSVFWGSAEGFASRTDLPTSFATANSVADLDKDGHLDLVFSCYQGKMDHKTLSLVFWGNASRNFQEKTTLETAGAHGNAVGDLDRDGFLDIIFSNHHAEKSVIYSGLGKRTFEKHQEFETMHATGVCAGADCSYGNEASSTP